MMKHAIKHAAQAAAMVLFMVSVAACGERKPAISDASGASHGSFAVKPASPASGEVRNSYASVATASISDMDDDIADDDVAVSASRPVMSGSMDEFQATAAELRHFAIYNNYVAEAHAARKAIDAQETSLVSGDWITLGKRFDCPVPQVGM